METTNMSALFFIYILAFLIQGNYEAAPSKYYDGVPSGILRPISGVVPISVPRRKPGALNAVLREIRARVDKSLIEELDSSIRNDIEQDGLAPPECNDHYGIRDGILKHNIRGIRDVAEAVIRDVQALGQGAIKKLPLVPNLINGVAEGLTYILCGAELGLSDVISGIDDAPDILTKVLVDLLELQGSAPLRNVPGAIVNLTKLARKIVSRFGHDVVDGIKEGVGELGSEVESGVEDVVYDVNAIVSGVENDVTEVVNAVDSGVRMIGGGVGDGVHSIFKGIKGGLGDIVGVL